jgi:mannose-6-phosphate isomerase-like protein (cupin superfamily)
MRIDAETAVVGPGDAIAIPPGTTHQITNTGREPLVFLCCCAPGYEHTDTVLEEKAEG